MKYIPEFEGLRGVLSIMVVIGHLYPPLGYWFWGSMDIFFAMSGFLIGSLLMSNQHRPGFYQNYALRRILRLWPAYYLVVLASIAAYFIFQAKTSTPSWQPGLGTLQYLFFLQNIELLGSSAATANQGYISFLGHTWSVALEEQAYVLIPLICVMLARSRKPRLWAGVLFVAAAAVGIVGRKFIHDSSITLPFRSDSFFAGLFLATVLHHARGQISNIFIRTAWFFFCIAGMALAAAYATNDEFPLVVQSSNLVSIGIALFAVFGTAAIALILAYQGSPVLLPLRHRVPVLLGQMSYSTYLWHIPIIWYSNRVLPSIEGIPTSLRLLVQLVLCFLAAYAAYLIVERPMIAYRRRVGSAASNR